LFSISYRKIRDLIKQVPDLDVLLLRVILILILKSDCGEKDAFKPDYGSLDKF